MQGELVEGYWANARQASGRGRGESISATSEDRASAALVIMRFAARVVQVADEGLDG
jgi:hypothetical protein